MVPHAREFEQSSNLKSSNPPGPVIHENKTVPNRPVADIPDLFACSAFGDTAQTALAEVEKAKEGWLETAKANGKPIPEPRYRPAIYQVGR